MADKEDIAKIKVKAASSSDTASFQCIAKNDIGEISTSAQFLVLGKYTMLKNLDEIACFLLIADYQLLIIKRRAYSKNYR